MRLKPIIISIFIVSILFLTGCGGSKDESQQEQQSLQSEAQPEKIPEQLKGMEDSIEKIIKELDGPAVEIEGETSEGGQMQGQKTGTQEQNNIGRQNNQSGGSQENQSTQQNQGTQQSQSTLQNQSTQESQSTQQNQSAQQNQSTQESQSTQQNQSTQKSQSTQQNQSTQQKVGTKSVQTSTQALNDPWKEITPIINDLHYKWNSYMPLSVKKGASSELVNNFSDAMNNLTLAIISKHKMNTLLISNRAYSYLAEFFFLYRTKNSPEIKKVRCYIRNAALNSMIANWTQAESDIANLKSSWTLYKNTINKENQESANMLDFSIYEFEKVIRQKNQPLSDIKGRVSLSNVQTLEKIMKQEEESEP